MYKNSDTTTISTLTHSHTLIDLGVFTFVYQLLSLCDLSSHLLLSTWVVVLLCLQVQVHVQRTHTLKVEIFFLRHCASKKFNQDNNGLQNEAE